MSKVCHLCLKSLKLKGPADSDSLSVKDSDSSLSDGISDSFSTDRQATADEKQFLLRPGGPGERATVSSPPAPASASQSSNLANSPKPASQPSLAGTDFPNALLIASIQDLRSSASPAHKIVFHAPPPTPSL